MVTAWRAGRSLGGVTSSDAGGAAGNDPQPGGPAEGGRRNAAAPGPAPHDDDPVRLTPPADPWLTEASTSVLGAAAPPPADTVPFAGMAHSGGETPYGRPSSGWEGGPPPRRRGRRATRWVVAVLAAGALFVAGMLAIDQFRSGGGDVALGPAPSLGATTAPTGAGTGRGRTPAAGPPGAQVGDVASTGVASGAATGSQPANSAGTAAPGASANAGAPEVVYQVTASGSRNVGSVSYIDQDGEIIRNSGMPLPWRTAFPMGAQRKPLVLIAQRIGGGDAGPVTCTITVDGKVLSTTTAHGKYAAPQCSGSG